MAVPDTEFSSYTPTNTIASSDSILIVRDGLPYRFTGALPALAADHSISIGPKLILAGDGATTGQSAAEIQLSDASAGHNWNLRMVDLSLGGQFVISTGTFGANALDYLAISQVGDVGIGTLSPSARLDVRGAGESRIRLNRIAVADIVLSAGVNGIYGVDTASADLQFATNGVECARLDQSGNFLVGITSPVGAAHTIKKAANQGSAVLGIYSAIGEVASFWGVSGSGYNPAGSAFYVNKHSATGRSISAAGTINANGADYAEYIFKAAGCGIIAAGDVCGFNADGYLTTTWSESCSFGVKSTLPGLVGSDTWAADLGPMPQAPAPIGPEPTLGEAPGAFADPQPQREDGEDDGAFGARFAAWSAASQASAEETAAYASAAAAFPDLHAAWASTRTEFDAAQAEFETALPAWDTAMEARRLTVDRIAFCGQVPVNFTGECQPGDYLIAVQDGDGIGIAAVSAADMTLPQYMKRLGKVLAIRDGRPWVDVQHG